MNTIRFAFKEWAVACEALAQGHQAIILRKGGIAEEQGEFQVEHTRFWLYPTFVHEKQGAIRPEALPLLQIAESQRPPAGHVHLTHFADVDGYYHLHDIASALKLSSLHLWSQETVQARFLYRAPGLYVLPVRVFRVPQAFDIPEAPAFAGCKTWVDLGQELSTEWATPVLSDAAFIEVRRRLEEILRPTAFA